MENIQSGKVSEDTVSGGMLRQLKAELAQQLCMIGEPDAKAAEEARRRWDSLGKPLHGLGLLEDAVIRMAGMAGTSDVRADRKAIVVMCADHGVVREGVTQTDGSVTGIVAGNLTRGLASVNIMAEIAGADVFPVDMGMAREDLPESGVKAADETAAMSGVHTQKELRPLSLCDRRAGNGTGDIAVEEAMTEEECIRAVLSGIEIAKDLTAQGYRMIGTGEMGIGNTTSSSALVSVLLDIPPDQATGRGAGLSDEAFARKKTVVRKAVDRYWEAAGSRHIDEGPYFKLDTATEVMAQLGGYEIAGMAGLCLGGAIYGVPVVLDGFISGTAALWASLVCGSCRGWLLASHESGEPASAAVLRALGLKPLITAGMSLGEGTGAAAAMPLYDMGLAVYHKMPTFDEIHVKAYSDFGPDRGSGI